MSNENKPQWIVVVTQAEYGPFPFNNDHSMNPGEGEIFVVEADGPGEAMTMAVERHSYAKREYIAAAFPLNDAIVRRVTAHRDETITYTMKVIG